MDLTNFPSTFRRHVEVNDNGCWLWTGGKTRQGYGRYKVGGKLVSPHTYAYEQECGPVPEGRWLTHTCGNPHCVNPAHLAPEDRAVSQQDAVLARKHSKVILTPNMVREIRRIYLAEDVQMTELARVYGVSPNTIRMAIRGETWYWVDDPGPIPSDEA